MYVLLTRSHDIYLQYGIADVKVEEVGGRNFIIELVSDMHVMYTLDKQ